MKNKYILLLTFFTIGFNSVYGQDKQVKNESKTKSHVYILASKISGGRGDNGRWSSYGFGYDLDWKLNKGWNIGLRANVRSWSERDKFLLPVNLGIGHSFHFSKKTSMDAFIGGGLHLSLAMIMLEYLLI